MTTINFVERDTKMSKRNQTTPNTKIYVCTATDPKTGWKTINSLTGKGNNYSTLVKDILINDRIISDDNDFAESFNDFFVT